MGVFAFPSEDDPPLVIDPNAVKPSKVAFQGLESIPRRCFQFKKLRSAVEVVELHGRTLNDIGWKSFQQSNWCSMKDCFRSVVTKRDDNSRLLSVNISVSRYPCKYV